MEKKEKGTVNTFGRKSWNCVWCTHVVACATPFGIILDRELFSRYGKFHLFLGNSTNNDAL
jgi:hypothetical protein